MEEKLTDKQVRIKAANLGVENLDDAELLSIIFREGDGTRSALDIARQLIDTFKGDITSLAGTDQGKLRSAAGLGLSRAVYIKAALELGNRCSQVTTDVAASISGSREVIDIFRPMISRLQHEEFWALYLNNAGRILDKVRISQGGINQTIVDHRIIVKRAVENLASSIIVVHNHPSLDPTPSQEDKDITDKLVQAAELFDIKIADHIIITSAKCYSMRANNLL